MQKNKVTIIGLGYVGLPLALTILETKKYEVTGFDINEELVKKINEKSLKLEDKYTKNLLKNLNFKASTNKDTLKNSEYIIICVPTPVYENKLPNLNPIISASKTILEYLESGQKIIVESTINPGVSEEIVLPILEENGLKGGKDFELSHCPERINPGDKKWNVKNIARNIGSLSIEGNKIVADFYRSFLDGEINELTTIKAAEATKIIENTFRDINIAYVNELAKSFDKMDIDLTEVIKAASNKPFAFIAHFPSCGVGGHCIPVDPYYLINKAKSIGFDHSFLKKAREVNNSMPHYTIELLEEKMEKQQLSFDNSTIALLGLSYKGDVADLRESPSLIIKSSLEQKNANLIIFDPYFPEKNTYKSLSETLKNADIIIVATDHQEFKNLNSKELKNNNIKIVIDGKNCLNKNELISNNITYKGIGR